MAQILTILRTAPKPLLIPSGVSFDTLARALHRLPTAAYAGHDGWDRRCRRVRNSGAWYYLKSLAINQCRDPPFSIHQIEATSTRTASDLLYRHEAAIR